MNLTDELNELYDLRDYYKSEIIKLPPEESCLDKEIKVVESFKENEEEYLTPYLEDQLEKTESRIIELKKIKTQTLRKTKKIKNIKVILTCILIIGVVLFIIYGLATYPKTNPTPNIAINTTEIEVQKQDNDRLQLLIATKEQYQATLTDLKMKRSMEINNLKSLYENNPYSNELAQKKSKIIELYNDQINKIKIQYHEQMKELRSR